MMIDVEDNGLEVTCGRGRNHNSLGTCFDMRFGLILVGKKSGTLQHHIYLVLPPWNL